MGSTLRGQRPARGGQAQKLTHANSLLGQGQRTSASQGIQAPSGTWNAKPGTRVELVPLMSFSTHVKVMPPSLLLSLKRSRKVPGGLVLRMARSRSLLMNPMMYLGRRKQEEQMWVRAQEQLLQDVSPASSAKHQKLAWALTFYGFPGEFSL